MQQQKSLCLFTGAVEVWTYSLHSHGASGETYIKFKLMGD